MRIQTLQVFDNVISGTSPSYSAAEFNRLIGAADYFAVQAYVTSLSGTATLTVASEHSGDSQNWIATGSTEINNVSLTNNTPYAGALADGLDYTLAGHVRLKITLGGTTPQCRLKLYVTTRAVG